MALFNQAFERSHDSSEWNPPLHHGIFSHGSLAQMFVNLGLVENLIDQHDEDPSTPYEFEELAVALANGEFDDRNPHHRALAKEYFESSIVLTR